MEQPTSQPLPEGFAELRQDLEQAVTDEGRDEFVARAKISTTTLQALLQGNLPWIASEGETPSLRQLRAWARSLARVAGAIGDPPAKWSRGTGLQAVAEQLRASADVNEALTVEQRRFATQVPSGPAKGGAAKFDVLSRIEWRARERARTGAVSVGIMEYSPFAEIGDRNSFLHQFARRLVGTINPEWSIEATGDPEIDHFLEDLSGLDPQYDIVMGLFDTVYRRYLGLDFISFLGWEISLSGICLWPDNEAHSGIPTWQDITEKPDQFYAVVIDGEVGYIYLKGPCRYHKDFLITKRTLSEYDRLATEFAADVARKGHAKTVFVADEETCRKVMLELNRGMAPDNRGSKAVPLRNVATDCPKYNYGFAFKRGDERWRDLLESTTFGELYGNDCLVTADLYGHVMVAGHYALKAGEDGLSCGWKPIFFTLPKADHLTRNFWRRVYWKVRQELLRREQVRGGHTDLSAEVQKRVRDTARMLMPDNLPPEYSQFIQADQDAVDQSVDNAWI